MAPSSAEVWWFMVMDGGNEIKSVHPMVDKVYCMVLSLWNMEMCPFVHDSIFSLEIIIKFSPSLTFSPPGTCDQHSHTASKITAMLLKHVPASRLSMSEPPPSWFGSPPNKLQNPRWDNATSQNWLKSRFHFSFAKYSSRLSSNFGVLRVMNDDFVQPDRGFDTMGMPTWK